MRVWNEMEGIKEEPCDVTSASSDTEDEPLDIKPDIKKLNQVLEESGCIASTSSATRDDGSSTTPGLTMSVKIKKEEVGADTSSPTAGTSSSTAGTSSSTAGTSSTTAGTSSSTEHGLASGARVADIETLPVEMLCHVLSFIKLPQQLKLATVCRRWRDAVDICLARRRLFSTGLFPGWACMTDQMLDKILPRLHSLHHLAYIYGGRLDLDIISRHCPHLRAVDLRTFRVTAPSLKRLCRSCPRLTTIYLPDCGDSCVEAVLRGLPELRSLELHLTHISGRCLALLPPGLQQLSVCGEPGLCRKKLRWAVPCPALTELDITQLSHPSTDDLAELLVVCPRLERLKARDSIIMNAFLERLPQMTPGIRELSLTDCMDLTEDGLIHLGRLKQLRLLSLRGTEPTDAVLERLCGAFHLTELVIGPKGYSRREEFSEEMLARLVISCPSLRRLNAFRVDVDLLIHHLLDNLSSDRDVTVFVDDYEDETPCTVDKKDLPENGPLHLTTYTGRMNEWWEDWEEDWVEDLWEH